MNSTSTLILSVLCFGVVLTSAAPNAPEDRRRIVLPPEPGNSSSGAQHSETTSLSSNYRITFSGISGDKSLGELSTLTCSPDVSVSGPLNATDTPTTFTVSGGLQEKDGELLFSYNIGFSLPVSTSTFSPPPNQAAPRVTSIQYQQHSSTGMLKMKPGKAYEVLKSAGIVYTITIAPEADQ